MNRVIHATLVAFLAARSAAALDDYPRVAGVDAVHYELHLTIPDSGSDIRGEARILFEIKAAGVSEVPLDFADLTVERVLVSDRDARFEHAGDKLRVALPGDIEPGARLLVAVQYRGTPSDGLYIKDNKFGERTIFADNWPNRAHFWFPGIDHPYDKATVEFRVTAPEAYDVIANGRLLETRSLPEHQKLTHWSESTPIPVYCMVIGAARFAVLHMGEAERAGRDVPLTYYLFPKDRDAGQAGYGRALRAVDLFSDIIGPYPYEKLALVQSSTRFGGMENASSIFFDEKLFDEGVVAHEIAHQWFGDSVTESDWHHLWLSESFATYFADVFFERLDGRDAMVRRMSDEKAKYLDWYDGNPRAIHDPKTTDLMALLNPANYEKGAWVLHMLRRELGDEAFFGGIRDYYRTFRDRTALTADFQKIMEFRAGRSLEWFFKQWIFQAGHPLLDAKWRWDAAAKQVRVTLRQTQKEPAFRYTLDIDLVHGEKPQRTTVEVSDAEYEVSIPARAEPRDVRLDPESWLLAVTSVSRAAD